MLPEWVSTIVVGIGAAGLGAGAALRKSGPEAEGIAVGTLKSVIQEMRAELDRKEVEMNRMRMKLDKLERNLTILSDPDNPPPHLG